jgi:hypothetical protein
VRDYTPTRGDKLRLKGATLMTSDQQPTSWPTASCCGEPRVTQDIDACYDHAKRCSICREPTVAGGCGLVECPTGLFAPDPSDEDDSYV